MREVRIQVEVPAPPEAVWEVFTDYRRWPEWSEVKEVVLRNEGEPAPNGIGAVCVLRSRGVAIEEEITAFEPPHRLRYRIVEGIPLRAHDAEVELVARGAGTELRWRVQLVPAIPGTGGLIGSLLRRELESIARSLAAYPFGRTRAAPGS